MFRHWIIRLMFLTIFLLQGQLILAQRQPRRPKPETRKPTSSQPQRSSDDIPGYYWNECSVARELFLPQMSRTESLTRANVIVTEYPNWHTYLPPCPQTAVGARNHPLFTGLMEWVKRNGESIITIPCFHPGADVCFRSVVGFPSEKFETEPLARNHGQQCCYTKAGSLITTGPAAGTPDFVHSSERDLHIVWDVLPWTLLSLNENKKVWPPNQGIDQPFRTFVFAQGKTTPDFGIGITLDGPVLVGNTRRVNWNITQLFVAEGDVLQFRTVKGRVKIGQETFSGPEGVKNLTPAEQQRLLLSTFAMPLTDSESPFGSLVGAIYSDEYNVEGTTSLDEEHLSKPFYIGAEKKIEILKSGYLLLSVNDTIYDDNSGYFIVEIQRVGNIPYIKPYPPR